jgi:2-iminobutanoate/2-iminopropanoate deaminase
LVCIVAGIPAVVILAACGCALSDVAKVNVYLTDMASFGEMNEAYLAAFGTDPPARITIGCSGLALGAAVEMDCVAFRPASAPLLPDIS